MPLASMTGFARADGSHGAYRWNWELKSVNGRNLDIRCRLPNGFESLEQKIRERTAAVLKRGNIQVGLQLNRDGGDTLLRLNEAVLAQVLEASETVRKKVETAPPRLDGLLAIRGVLELAEPETDEKAVTERDAALLASYETALNALCESRNAEGAKLETVITAHVTRIEELAENAAGLPEIQPEALRTKLREQVADLLSNSNSLSEERLAQEAAILITKSDIREEIDRLRAHVAAARNLIAEADPVGRRLDFLTQEFHRESNTLCAKSPSIALTRIGLDLKAVTDQLREQVQNVE